MPYHRTANLSQNCKPHYKTVGPGSYGKHLIDKFHINEWTLSKSEIFSQKVQILLLSHGFFFLILLSCYCFQIILTLFHEMLNHRHCIQNARMPNFSGPYFSAFGLNTERYGVFLHIQSKCGKIRTRKTPNTDTFHTVTPTTIFSQSC